MPAKRKAIDPDKLMSKARTLAVYARATGQRGATGAALMKMMHPHLSDATLRDIRDAADGTDRRLSTGYEQEG